jgi:hypothetical protein
MAAFDFSRMVPMMIPSTITIPIYDLLTEGRSGRNYSQFAGIDKLNVNLIRRID